MTASCIFFFSKIKMKIATLTASIGPDAGGLFFSVRALSQGLGMLPDNEVSVFSLGQYPREVYEKWLPLEPKSFQQLPPKAYGFSPKFGQALFKYAPDVIHSHGIWMYPSRAAWKFSKSSGAPIVVSPRGMLDLWALNNSAWKKKIIGNLFEYRFLRDCACFHALNESEAVSIRAFGLNQPICVIPNGVVLPEQDVSPEHGDKKFKRLTFIGRIHPKKGIESLIRAWALLRQETKGRMCDWRLSVAGWDDGGHIKGYKDLSEQLGCHDSIEWLGSVYGDEKHRLLSASDAFILPSFSEGLPMSILEAWSYRLPVVMTQECNLPEGFEQKAAIEVTVDPVSIRFGLKKLFDSSEVDLWEMGNSGFKLVNQDFTWEKQVKKMQLVYEWLLNRGEKPDFIYLKN